MGDGVAVLRRDEVYTARAATAARSGLPPPRRAALAPRCRPVRAAVQGTPPPTLPLR